MSNSLAVTRALRRVFVAAIRIYVLLALILFFFQRSFLYFPTHYDSPPRGVPPFQPWSSGNGEFLGYVRDSGGTPKRVAVLFHGNGGEAINRSWLNDLIPAQDVILVLAEHPGYGGRVGEPSEASLVGAGHGVISEINRRWHLPITVIGESLGSGVACAVAGDPGVDRLALISPFYSALDVAKRKLPVFPMSILMKDTYRSDLALRSVKVPLYIVHGTDDDVVPFASGKALFDSYGGGLRWMAPASGRKHNDMLDFILKDGAAAQFRAFLVGIQPLER